MADKVTLQVELQNKLEQTRGAISKLKEKGGFKDNSKAEQQIHSLIQELDSLAKITNPSLKNLSRIDALFNQLSEILLKVAHATSNTSKEFQALEKKLQQQQEAEEKLRKERSGIFKQGRINKDTGKYELFTKYQDEVVSQSGIKNKKGQAIKTVGTFLKKFDENGNPVKDAFQNPEEAKKIYDSLKRTQQENETRLKELNQKLAEYKTLIEKTNVELAAQSKKEDSPLAGEIIQNKVDINRRVEEEKEQIHTAQDMKEATNAVEGFTKATDKQSSALGRAFKQFTLYHIAVRSVKTALREAVHTVKELDKYLTEQAMVTGLTREQTYGLVKEYQNLALQCGATTKEIASVATEYMKQGKTVQESLTLTKAAVSAAKVARVSVGDSVNYLTTALNGFRLSAEDAMRVSDKFAAVAASSATDYDELAIALSKVASQANLAGMSIDYTTALLTKGLETTREAPETMGTALKTIIARMRELSDYGETLEGDTDINNVESQLSYVGIALRDTNGELRSTQDVLDELGKKWDTLNKNQQAAMAKALAGTRQQSRLIAMMDDYERVIELQEISQRSAGATAAQAGVYLEGIEASMNKIQVAWEKIIMTVTDSEAIINVFDWIGNTLDDIGDFLSTTKGMTTALVLAGSLTAIILSNKYQEHKLQQLSYRLQLQENEVQLKKTKSEKAEITAAKQAAEIKAKQNRDEQKALVRKLKGELALEKDATKKIELQKALNEAQVGLAEAEKQYKIAHQELGKAKTEELLIDAQIAENLSAQRSTMGLIGGLWNTIITPITTVLGLITTLKTMYWGIVAAKKAEGVEIDKNTKKTILGTIAEKIKAGWALASSAGAIPVIGWGIGLSILAAIGIRLAVNASKQEKYNKSAEGTAESINKISNEIYKLNAKANEINNITTAFDKLDNKLIKTNSDLKEMSSLLDQAADKLDTEADKEHDWYGGKSEKEYYESFKTEEGRRRALKVIEDNNRKLANEERDEAINKIKSLPAEELARFLDDETTDAEIAQAQDTIYAYNNNKLYEYIDLQKESGELTKEQATAVESLTQSILEGMSVEEAWGYVQDNGGKKVESLARSLQELTMVVQDVNGKMVRLNVGSILNSDDYSLKDQVEAFEKTRDALLKEYGSASEEFKAFSETFSQYEFFTKLEGDALDFVDSVGMSINELNDLYGAWEKLQKRGVNISQEDWENNFELYLETLAATQGDVLAATELIFGEYLDDSEDALNAFIEAYGDIVQVGILNMGQNIDKVKNSINNFYEKALEWDKMSESDKAEFIQDNAELFSDGNLLQAFESGNYEDIEKALSKNEAFQKQLEQRRKEIAQELLIEEARTGEARNEAYIAQLKAYQEYLNDTENLFKASLEVRLEQEQAQLDEYRSYLEDQQEALEDSLNKRKEAYEKYFDEINKEEEDEDYENQAELLISNISKLGATTNASAQRQTKELEQQFKELEKERLKELRERAQEAVMENMDDTLEEISDKFDKLLESNQALLAVMKGDLNNPVDFISDLIDNKIKSGATALEVQDYIGSLQSTYGSVLGNNVEWDAIQVREENNQLFLNVNGNDIPLDTNNEQTLYQAIMKALREVGLR